MLGALLDPLGLAGPRKLENDSFIALRAGASQPFGVVVIAGTGHVAAGRNPAGRTARTLGLGPMYGDFGSATDVAAEAVRAVADAYTGRGPATTLSWLLPALAGCASAEQLLQRLSRGMVPLPAAAPLVLAEAEAGDPACREIVLGAGAALGQSAAVVARRLGLGRQRFELVMAGGLFQSRNRLLEGTLVDTVARQAPLAAPVHLTCKPVVGAALEALELAGIATDPGVHARLVASFEALAVAPGAEMSGLVRSHPPCYGPSAQ
jgi:N-acetylglucosamine kinase-like BadF-type ATPase